MSCRIHIPRYIKSTTCHSPISPLPDHQLQQQYSSIISLPAMFFAWFTSLILLATYTARLASGDAVLTITNLENCQEYGDAAAVTMTTVEYHKDPVTGTSPTVHGTFLVKSGDFKPRILTITLYKCKDPASNEPCQENPVVYEETLDCDRLIGDDSGPWAMFSRAIARSNCGQSTGEFSMDYSTMKLQHLMKYLDIHDNEWGRYRLRIYFHSTQTNSIRACFDLDFKLVV